MSGLRTPGGIALAAGIGVATTVSPVAAAGAVLGSIFLWLALSSPALAFAGFLVARSSLDALGEAGISVGGAQMNVAGGLGLLLIAFAATVYLVDRSSRRPFGVGGLVGKGWLIFVAISLSGALAGSTTMGAAGVMLAIKDAMRLASLYAVFYLAFALFGTGDRPRRLIALCFLSLLVPCLVAFGQLVVGSSTHFVGETMRIHGTFGHPNAFGRYLGMFVIMGVAMLLARRTVGESSRVWLAMTVTALFALIVFSYSRSSLLLCVLGVIVLVARGYRRGIPVLLGAAVLVAVFLGGRIADRFSDIRVDSEVMVALAEGRTSNSLEWRVMNWMMLIETGRESPWLGHGTRTAALVNPMRNRNQDGELFGYSAHNEFVRAFVEHGFPGLFLLIVGTGMVVRGVSRARRRLRPDDPLGAVGDALFAALMGFVAIGLLAGEYLSTTAVLYVFMSLAGVLYRASVESEREPDSRPEVRLHPAVV